MSLSLELTMCQWVTSRESTNLDESCGWWVSSLVGQMGHWSQNV